MAARTESEGRRAMTMFKPMPPALCCEALELAAGHGPLCCIADFDWTEWKSVVPPALESLAAPQTAPSVTPAAAFSVVGLLERTPEAGRRTVLVNFLRAQAARILGLTDDTVIDERQPLIQMGLDSLMAIEFRNRLMEAFTRPLSATLLFDCPTIGALADHLGGKKPTTAAAGNELLEAVRQLTDEEAEALLGRELNSA
jgi:aryl carrier-like protein